MKNLKITVHYIKADCISNIEEYFKTLNICVPFNRYSIIVRVSYLVNYKESEIDNTNISTEWKTLGEQIPFMYTNQQDLYKNCTEIISIIKGRLDYILELYNVKHSDVLVIQLLIYKLAYTTKIVSLDNKIKYNLKNLESNRDLINLSYTERSINIIPLISDINEFGVKLEKKILDNKVESIKLINGVEIDFYSRVLKYNNKIEKFDSNLSFYQREVKSNTYIIIVNNIKRINNIINNITVYDLLGFKLCSICDNKIENTNSFIRTVGNIKFYIDNKYNIIKKEILQDFKPIKQRKVRGYKASLNYSDYRIGTMDLETYINKDSISKTYSIGFYIENDINIYYIDNSLNSDLLIMKCLDGMLKEKYNKYTFYVHNFSRFDVSFILRVIIEAKEKNPDIYDYNLIMKDSLIICLNISKKYITSKTTKKYSIKIVDSYNILKASLSDLCKTYKPDVIKTVFPYNFVKENTLFYEGKKPDISYYNIDLEEYKNIQNKSWSVQKETEKYLQNDLISLYSIMDIFKKHIWLNYELHINDSYTISGIAMNIYLNNFYNNNIPLINKKSVYNNIRSSYYGGITEVYKPYGNNLYYYDVNSLYPFSALKDMPGMNCVYTDNINLNLNNCLDLFGFYYSEIETNNQYIGLIPTRTDSGSLMMIEGKFKGWYFSEELKFALNNGYKVFIKNGYTFNRERDVFKEYVEHFYNIKKTTKDVIEKATAKSLLNNLLGRFGLNINNPITRIMDENEFIEILQTRRIVGDIKYIGNKILVTYDSIISPSICEKNNVNFMDTYANIIKNTTKNVNNLNKQKTEDVNNVSVAISSAITAYSRIYMNQIKLDILSKGGSIYYTDTDSIVTDIELSNNIVNSNIGMFKKEYFIKEGYFLSSKTYCLVLQDNTKIIKVKGVNKPLSLEDFKNLYNGKDVKTTRFESHRNMSEGYTNINISRSINLSSDSYKKREKIYCKGKWIDTKPINNINNINNVKKYSTQSQAYTYFKLNNDLQAITILKNCVKYMSILCFIMLTSFIILLISALLGDFTQFNVNEVVPIKDTSFCNKVNNKPFNYSPFYEDKDIIKKNRDLFKHNFIPFHQ